MSNYSTPDVYVEEVSLLPPSVAGVSTAIPAFIGFTAKSDENITNVPVRISTFLEYKEIFGLAAKSTIVVTVDNEEKIIESLNITPPDSTLYYAMDMYFRNGGGECYIISIGSDSDVDKADKFSLGIKALSKEDEPTLIVLCDAVNLAKTDYHTVCQEALKQCEDLKDRFCILDIQNTPTGVDDFRNGIGNDNLKYGAAYTPFLHTALNYVYDDKDVSIVKTEIPSGSALYSVDYLGIRISFAGSSADQPAFRINGGTGKLIEFGITDAHSLTISKLPAEGVSAADLLKEWDKVIDKKGFDIEVIADPTSIITTTPSSETIPLDEVMESSISSTLDSKKGTALYSNVVNEIAKKRIVLPPSASVAGVYAATDRQRGVWKAPANISLNGVIAPVNKISSKDQELLNVDTDGKSINAIRSFVGKGTLIWGARTLAGNDNEWRYVPVRRLFNFIEESTKKASYFAVFEPNDTATWLKVKAMIESFLYGIWQQGGLVGATEEQAYFVNIGLGKTMTQQDIREGRMIVEIGIAAARPAEFIVLKFSHKLQEV